jgi:hypothetical protein
MDSAFIVATYCFAHLRRKAKFCVPPEPIVKFGCDLGKKKSCGTLIWKNTEDHSLNTHTQTQVSLCP